MKRMQTFFTYALVVILFWIFSNIAISLILKNSYKSVDKNNIEIAESNNGFQINVEETTTNKRQSYFTGTVKNTSNKVIDKQYLKVDAYFKGKIMQSKYLAFENMQPGEERKFKLLYEIGNIDQYKVSYVDEIPINRTIVDDAIDSVIDYSKKFLNQLAGADIKGTAGEVADGVKASLSNPTFETYLWIFSGLYVMWSIPAGWLIIF